MMNRHFLTLGLATASLLAAPLAFAQNAHANANAHVAGHAQPAVPATPATPADPQEGAPAVRATPATPAEPARQDNPVTGSELDTDDDGALSKTEAAPVDSLNAAFDSADSDKDGSLTADEYKAWLATNRESPNPQR